MNPDKDDLDWLEIADAIADMKLDDVLVEKKPKEKLGKVGISDIRGTEIDAIWIDEAADFDEDKLKHIASFHEEKNALVKINDIIAVQDFAKVFHANAPYSATTKDESGNFKKKRILGGEKFTAVRAYKGKKSTIFVFNVDGWKGITAELTKADASKYLNGFDDWYDRIMSEHGERVLRDAKKTVVEVEKEASERYEAQGDTNFGSW